MSAPERSRREPTGPSPHRDRFRPVWLAAWVAAGLIGTIVLVALWFTGGRTEVLASVGGLVAVALSVAIHHLVVTQDAGEERVQREPVDDAAAPRSTLRRRLLGGALGGLVVMVAGVVGLRRFGPEPMRGSAWAEGSPLVTIAGDRLRPADIPLGGVVTVWPEDAVGTERAAVMVIRLREEPEEPTRLDGVADGTLVAYSRLCTHAGCAVALYRDFDQALFCPCHQATFDARRGATPTAGPASVPLPQLPLAVADDGTLVATGDLTDRPGPVGGTVHL